MVKIQAPDAVEVSFDTSNGIAAPSGRGLDVLPRDHGDILLNRPEIYQWLDKGNTLFQRASIDEVGEEICLEIKSTGVFLQEMVVR